MSTASTIKTWYLVHKWTSLVCTLFLLIICITGLPLVFHHEIEHLLDEGKPVAQVAEGTPDASLDTIVARAHALYPDEYIDYVFLDDEEPQVYVGFTPKLGQAVEAGHAVRVDARTGDILHDGPKYSADRFSFMGIMLALHVDLYAGLAGELFLGLMGLLFVIAIVSGVVLYGPFMKKLDFGTVRASRSNRLKWLDLHNLLGIVTLVWAFVVGLTGVINELSTPLFRLWQQTELQAMTAPYQGKPVRGRPSCRRRSAPPTRPWRPCPTAP